jgi:hypothetical protein
MRSFETWTYEEVEDVFGIIAKDSSPDFEDWLKATACDANESEKRLLDDYRKLLLKEVKNWNEDELKLFFIGPVLACVNFNTLYFKPFTQRTLTVQHGNISASGKVDFLLAKGKLTPKIPYFCLHEYKQENRRDNDPLGQLLIGMVAAQAKNNNGLPVYGCYVSGRNWFFVMLEGENYFLSNAYNASDNDIYQIFAILKKCKILIEAHSQSIAPSV